MFDSRWEQHLAGIELQDASEAVESMKAICSDLMAAVEGRASRRMRALMGASAERLFAAVNQRLGDVFAAAAAEAEEGRQPPSRAAKYALNVMLQGLAVPEVAAGLPQVRTW